MATPLSAQPSPRPLMPRGIIVTPSSPRKPEHRRDTPGISSAAHRRLRDASAAPLSPFDSEVMMVNDRESIRTATTTSSPPLDDRGRYLGIGRPQTHSWQSSSGNCSPHLLSVDAFSSPLIPAQRSASLPVREREGVVSRPNSPQGRSISFTSDASTGSQSAADDSRVGSQRQRDERVNRKIIRKTRSFSDVLSRNRKGRTEADGNPVTKPLITWNTPKQSVKERDRDNDAPLPVPLIPTTRKQSGNLLKSAVDIFQFRKTRPSSEPNSGQGSPSDHNEQDGSHETSVAVDVANEAPSVSVGPLPAPHALGEEQVKARASSTILQRPLDNPLERLRDGDINDRFDSDGGPAEVWSRIGHSVKTVESRSQRDAPPFSALAESTLQIEESHMPQKPTSNSRPRSGTTTPSDWEFKRPQIGSRAQSTSSSTYGDRPSSSGSNSPAWLSGGPNNGISVSRSTTIRAVNMIRPRPTSDISAISMVSSSRNSPQSSVDGFGQEYSQPVSILRSGTPVSTPPSHSAFDSPSVSFVGQTPRISISSTSSHADSAKDQARARRFTSTSQENVRNSLPAHHPKASRPRSSTLFSSPPVWLASASLASPEKKRSTLIRRLSAGLIAPLDEKDDPRFQTSPQELQKHQSDYFGEPDSRSSVNVTPTIPDRYPEETTELWMARLTEVVKRTEIAAVLASK